MIDHTQLAVAASDHKATVVFYERTLSAIGYAKLLVFGPNEEYVGFGDRAMPHHQKHTDWWIVSRPEPEKPAKSHHAFRCKDRAAVDAWYEAAIEAGGKDNGKPGLRNHYHANYYGAFVIDPAGNNIEAVCHEPL
ncbi:Glyoxalase/Bleomycin resistance protein/Dihydroxybiphenyl dioxygenase [Coniella lustricola]|uniref:Glyoxalase/Bleomycin resistance protein/Dihydroxybiphenyl dioxygenase n=1 Tax=Coniella lustricola TaxID=2025994 RepID=A0A2T3AD43_9PEZI|nr:Glyoxalase/Bleomycin resistance protein/Dihydroxybiphenyl dioxygenase [Coniella lustricola]